MLTKILFTFLSVILATAYLSLLERKIIARIQMRLGPSYHGYFGLLQPIADAMKLFLKRGSLHGHSNHEIIAVCILMFSSLMSVTIIPLSKDSYIFNPEHGVLYASIFYIIINFAETMIGVGNCSSKYGMLGGMRSYFQHVISHLPLLLSVISIILITRTFNFIEIVEFQENVSLMVLMPPIFVIFSITSLILLNRTPFDFTEAESELVAGNHTEYGGMLFGMIYLSEYINLMFTSSLIVILFLGGWNPMLKLLYFVPPQVWMLLKTFFVMSAIIATRAILPRYKNMRALQISLAVLCPIAIAYMIWDSALFSIVSKI